LATTRGDVARSITLHAVLPTDNSPADHRAQGKLCLSPQCGFSSTYHGNALSEADQWNKLELIVGVAREVWGTA
jgi:hypothetical protein